MKALVVALALIAAPRIARADAWTAEGCRENGGDFGGCNCDNDSDSTIECSCTTSDPVSIGTSLGLFGLVAWRVGRKRRSR